MINKNEYLKSVTEKLKDAFKDRLLFIGLQGSYVRGEQTERSDFDLVVVLENPDISDLDIYRSIIDTMPEPDKACGFIGGRAELAAWPKYDLLQFSKETEACYGTLDGILPEVTDKDIQDSVKIGAANIYHAACHTYVHAPKAELDNIARGLYKAASFIVQMSHYLKTKEYVTKKLELVNKVSGNDKYIMSAVAAGAELKQGTKELYETLISWSADLLKQDPF
ncbi:Nucleotidyltransferase domain-containing protein [Parelusimicrobium proximum]|uniref:nucleotidyltransferase domain-containing protein n=1 Tax=Parelusimicrobium proximum TaxID=3228953 RepID=UPI003D16E4D5